MTALERVLWIGGAQWAGKTSVAQTLAMRFGVLHYSYDYHDARSHLDRGRNEPERFPHRAALARAVDDGTFSEQWVTRTPAQLAEDARRNFVDRFAMVLDDLAALPDDVTVVAEGYGLRPEMVAPLISDPRKAVFLVPSEAFRAQQIATLPRAMRIGSEVSDPERAQRNRLERDRILRDDVVAQAKALNLEVIEVDGTIGVPGVTRLVEERFPAFLPNWLY